MSTYDEARNLDTYGEEHSPDGDGTSVSERKEAAKKFIKDATAALKGPMPNIVRAMLVADRKDARVYLKTLETEK